MTVKSPHVERMEVEHKALAEKVIALRKFFTTEIFIKLSDEERDLMYQQEKHMTNYAVVLDKRIDLANKKS